jgi:hypothetical protein
MSSSLGGRKILFSSPVRDTDPVPLNALQSTDAPFKAQECRKALVSDILNELRGIAATLSEDDWRFEGESSIRFKT